MYLRYILLTFHELFILGLMSNSAKHFCAWCTTKEKKVLGEKRTFSSIKSDNKKWLQEKQGIKKFLMNFNNCENEPLIMSDTILPIIKFICPPELHILIGIVTHLFVQLEKDFPEIADTWISQLNLKFFHGSHQFNGNTARKLLKKYSVLQEIDPGSYYLYSMKNIWGQNPILYVY